MDDRLADFDRFVAENTDAFLRTAYLIAGEIHEAEDLVQETLLKVARRWPRVRRTGHPAAYARRILVNSLRRRRAPPRRGELAAGSPPEAADLNADPSAGGR